MHTLSIGNRFTEISPPLPAIYARKAEETFSIEQEDGEFWYGYDRKSSTIYTGLVPFFKNFAKKYRIEIELNDQRVKPEGKPFKSNWTMRDYQEPAVQKMLKVGRGMLSACTGAGKTSLILDLFSHIGVSGLVIVPTQIIWGQFLKTAIKMYLKDDEKLPKNFDDYSTKKAWQWAKGKTRCDIGIIGQSDWEPGFLTIAIAAAIDGSKRSREFLKSVEFFYADECFHPKTRVLLPGGERQTIKELVDTKYNGPVVCWDEVNERYTEANVIGWVKKKPTHPMVRVSFGRVGAVSCTDNHEFLTLDGWREAKDLRQGDMIIAAPDEDCKPSSEARYLVVRNVQPRKSCEYVYCLEVEGHHNFIANSVVAHNCHHLAADTWFDAMMRTNAYYRFGGSGTVLRTDGQDMKLFAPTGPILYTITASELIRAGWLAKPIIKMIRCRAPGLGTPTKWADYYRANVAYGSDRTSATVALLRQSVKRNIKTLCIVGWDEHAANLLSRIQLDERRYIDYVKSGHGKKAIQEAIERFASGEVRVLMATTLLSEGYDLCSIDRLIRASGMESFIKVTQETGRVLRINNAPQIGVQTEVFDFYDMDGGGPLTKHSQSRLEAWQSEEEFDVSVDDTWMQMSLEDQLSAAYSDYEPQFEREGMPEASDRVTDLLWN